MSYVTTFTFRAMDGTRAVTRSIDAGLRRIDGALASVRERAGRAGRALRNVGQSGTITTLPVTIALGGAVRAAGNFEASMNRVGAVSGATEGQLARLTAVARDLGSTTRFSATEAAQGMTFLAMAGFQVHDIATALPGVLQLAAAANMDLADSADIVSNIMTGYGVTARDTGRMNDVLVGTLTRSNTNLRQLGDAMKYVGPLARVVGMDFALTSAILGRLGDAGIQGEMAGTALRGALTRLLNPTREVNDALQSLGVSVTDSTGALLPFDQILSKLEPHAGDAAAMMRIFGLRAGPAMVALLNQGTSSIFGLQAALDASGGTAQRVADIQMKGLNGALVELRSSLEGLAIASSNGGFLSVLERLTDRITGTVREVTAWDSATQTALLTVASAVVVLPPALAAIGFMTIGISGLAGAASFAAGALGLLFSPITIVAGLIGALLVSLPSARAAFARLGGSIRDTLSPVLSGLSEKLGEILGGALRVLGLTTETRVSSLIQKQQQLMAQIRQIDQEIEDAQFNVANNAAGQEFRATGSDPDAPATVPANYFAQFANRAGFGTGLEEARARKQKLLDEIKVLDDEIRTLRAEGTVVSESVTSPKVIPVTVKVETTGTENLVKLKNQLSHVKRYMDDFGRPLDVIADVGRLAFQRLENDIMRVFEGGKFSFDDFAKHVATGFLRL